MCLFTSPYSLLPFSFCLSDYVVVFSHSVVSSSLQSHGLQLARPPCPSLSPSLVSIQLMLPSNHLILCHPLLLLPMIFPSIRVFSNESALWITWPKYWTSASTSVISMNIQDWFPLGLTGWISLLTKGLCESSPVPQFKSINFSALSLLYGPTLTSIHDYWKNHSFDYMDLCWQNDVFAFWYTV